MPVLDERGRKKHGEGYESLGVHHHKYEDRDHQGMLEDDQEFHSFPAHHEPN
jgi:hypothetical protein